MKKEVDTLSNFELKNSVFQHQLFFKLVEELFKYFEALGWSVKLRIESKCESVLT